MSLCVDLHGWLHSFYQESCHLCVYWLCVCVCIYIYIWEETIKRMSISILSVINWNRQKCKRQKKKRYLRKSLYQKSEKKYTHPPIKNKSQSQLYYSESSLKTNLFHLLAHTRYHLGSMSHIQCIHSGYFQWNPVYNTKRHLSENWFQLVR